MKYALNVPSALRQNIDILGAQFDPKTTRVDPLLVMKTCQNVAMAATDKQTPLPDDIFAPGINDEIARIALSGLAMAVMSTLRQQMATMPGAPKPS